MERDPIMFERLRMAVGMAKTAATAVSNPSAELLRELETLDAAMEDGRIAVYKQPPVDLDDIMVPVDQPDFGLSFNVADGDFEIRDGQRVFVVHRASVTGVAPVSRAPEQG